MGFLYKLTFSNGKEYIGITRRSISSRMQDHRKNAKVGKRGYAVHSAWIKYGEPKISILAILENEELTSAEIRAIRVLNTLVPNGYNLTLGGEGVHTGRRISESTREKLRVANLGKKQSAETCAKRSKSAQGRVCSEETRRKIGEKNRVNSTGKHLSDRAKELVAASSRGRTHTVSEEGRMKMRLAKLGTKQTPESIEKRRIANTGRTHSAETKEKLRLANVGKVISEEAKAKMRAAKIGKPWSEEHRAQYLAKRVLTASTTRID